MGKEGEPEESRGKRGEDGKKANIWREYFKTDSRRLHGSAVQTNNDRLVDSNPVCAICFWSLSFATYKMDSNTLHSAMKMKKDLDLKSVMIT